MNATRPDEPKVFSPDRALEICLRIHDILFLDTDEDTGEDFYNFDKVWDTDFLPMIAETLREVVQQPENVDVPPAPASAGD